MNTKIWTPIFEISTKITGFRHPDYTANYQDWELFKYTFAGGRNFTDKYLVKYSNREDSTDFYNRKSISYCPAHAKAAIIDIKNSIYQRMFEISRENGPQNYRDAIRGKNGGVDLEGRTMSNFIGTLILPELLSIGKVGVYVDKFPLPENATLRESTKISPYVYHYPALDILSWTKQDNQLTSLLLRDYIDITDPVYNLAKGTELRYRYLKLTADGVILRLYDKDGNISGSEQLLRLSMIPFAVAEISQSLLCDVADYQIALLNLESSDIGYSLQSNFPFYTEQFDPRMVNLKKILTEDEETGNPVRKEVTDSGNPDIQVGAAHGRAYPKGFDRPGFIHPSAEPLMVSMQKQDKLKQDIRKLVNLSLSNLERPSGSEPAKELDTQGLEAGLSYIGLELEQLERKIGVIWSDYERSSDIPEIKYPEKYELETDKERRQKASELSKLKEGIPSVRYQKEISKQIAKVLLEQKISTEDLDEINNEIDTAVVLITDHETIREDHDAGLVSTKTASKAAGYPDGEVEQAKIDHADRAARIALAQSKIANRGVSDLQNPGDPALDKKGKDGRGSVNDE